MDFWKHGYPAVAERPWHPRRDEKVQGTRHIVSRCFFGCALLLFKANSIETSLAQLTQPWHDVAELSRWFLFNTI